MIEGRGSPGPRPSHAPFARARWAATVVRLAQALEQKRRVRRRCLHLRAALGARPQIVAAQALLADNLPADDPERAELTEAYRPAAAQLRIGWLVARD